MMFQNSFHHTSGFSGWSASETIKQVDNRKRSIEAISGASEEMEMSVEGEGPEPVLPRSVQRQRSFGEFHWNESFAEQNSGSNRMVEDTMHMQSGNTAWAASHIDDRYMNHCLPAINNHLNAGNGQSSVESSPRDDTQSEWSVFAQTLSLEKLGLNGSYHRHHHPAAASLGSAGADVEMEYGEIAASPKDEDNSLLCFGAPS